jgi:hypothetical protein
MAAAKPAAVAAREFPFRETTVPGVGSLKVPRFISRVDISADAQGRPKHTHGWQVRYKGNNKFFSDSGDGAKGATASLKEAEAHLAAVFTGFEPRFAPRRKSKNENLVEAYIRLVKVRNGGENLHYLEVRPPSKAIVAKRVLVGNDKTATKAKIKAVLPEARAIRAEFEKIHAKTLKSVSFEPRTRIKIA